MLLMLVIWLPWCFLRVGHLATWVPSLCCSSWSFGYLGVFFVLVKWRLGGLILKLELATWPFVGSNVGPKVATWPEVLRSRVGHLARCLRTSCWPFGKMLCLGRRCLGPAFLDASVRVGHDA